MTASTIVPLSDLAKAIQIVFDSFKTAGTPDLTIENDYFWDVPETEIFELGTMPTHLTLGQVSDSWEFLQHATERDEVQVAQTLIWIADILRAAAIEKIYPDRR